ncbi:hypothetical protein KVP10_08470 [Candidimonas humi]|uniref:Uncharacterized protein n=1 Tax=Candidimonas humi TaxID=683355 RepID=A0ABV8NXT0_9BURK|nr:hypothetical protein [Candidimonas humi]MBV6304920.1 hypothetical protein [Candidimonas humi]
MDKSTEFRRRVAANLRRLGIFVDPEKQDCRDIAKVVARATGNPIGARRTATEYLEAYAQESTTTVVPARSPRKFRPYRPAPHLRAADIDRDQPDLITPCGVGNGSENSPIWTR